MSCETSFVRVRLIATVVLLVIGDAAPLQCFARQHEPAPAAIEQFSIGQAAIKRNDATTAAEAFRKAIDLDPAYFEAHFQYIRARYLGKTGAQFAEVTAALTSMYQRWAAEHPESALYAWALGYINQNDAELATRYYQQAIQLDPQFAEAYADLAFIKGMQGDKPGELAAYKQAAEVGSDPGYLASYFYALVTADPKAADDLVQREFKKKYPKSDWTAMVMVSMAQQVPLEQRRARLEEVKAMFPPAEFEHSASAMRTLYQDYLLQDPEKALSLAKEMLQVKPWKEDPKRQEMWSAFESAASSIVDVRWLIAAKQFSRAVEILNTIKLSIYPTSENPLPLLLAECEDGMGEAKTAYDRIVHAFATKPTEVLQKAALAYGAKLGKSNKDVDRDAWQIVEAQAQPAPDFTLPRYGEQKEVRLSDYRGHVVLLDFWFPGCGPCRGQFPFLEQVFNKYSPSGRFQYFGVNVSPEEDSSVLPFVSALRYHFTPLKADRTFAREKYKAVSFPTTFLIDAKGEIIARVMARTAETEKTLEMQVKLALAHAGVIEKKP